MTVGMISTDSFGRFTFPIVEALEEQLADQRHRGLHVQRHRRSRARAPASRPAAGQAHRRPGRHRPPRRQAPADRPARRRPAGDLRLSRRPTTRTRSACSPTTRAARGSRSQHLRRARPPAHRPRHRARALRGGAAPAPRLSHGARRGRPAGRSPASTSPASGRRPGAARRSPGCSTAAPSRPTRCSAATTRSPAAPPMRCASAASRVPGDVAIVGFDNWDVMTEATRPPLTSVDMNLYALGREAGDAAARHDRRREAPRHPPPALHPRRPRIVAAAAETRGRLNDAAARESAMSQYHAGPLRRCAPRGRVLARAARHRADAHHPEPAREARRVRHPRIR